MSDLPDDFEAADITGWFDIGNDHWLAPFATKALDPGGYFVAHRATGNDWQPAGEWCIGSVSLRGAGTGKAEWDVISLNPIHLEPSVLCSCGDHGFIRGGKWITA